MQTRKPSNLEPEWHYIRDGESAGPVSTEELRDLIGRGLLNANDLVWRDGMAEWESIASQKFVPPAPTPPPIPSAASSRRPQRRSSRRKQGVPPQLVIWSIVGIVVVLLCGGWWYMSKPPSASRRVAQATTDHSRRSTAPVSGNDNRKATDEPRMGSPTTQQLPMESPRNDASDLTSLPPPEISTTEPEPTVLAEAKEPPAATAAAPPEPAPVASQSDPAEPKTRTIYQRVNIKRQPAFSMSGFESKQSLHYEVASQLDVEVDASKGRTKVVQIVVDTRLLAADEMSRANFEKALTELKRQQYTYLLNEFGEVIEFTGHKKSRAAIPVDLSSVSGFQMTSVIDEDGWRELAELTFLKPPSDREQADPWQRQMKHDWDSLGSWSGVTTFTPQSVDDGIQKINFSRNLTYHPPGSSSSGLPFKITGAEFKIQEAAGEISFDLSKNLVRSASEAFRVRGNVTAELASLGGTTIGLTEQQEIAITVSEQRPSLQ